MHLQNQKYWDDSSILSHVEAKGKKSHENMSYCHHPFLSKKNKKHTNKFFAPEKYTFSNPKKNPSV